MTQEQLPHMLTLSDRNRLTMTGVADVVSFEETAVELTTSLGVLMIQGSGLKLKTLVPEGGKVELTGRITSLSYEEHREPGGWFRRLLG